MVDKVKLGALLAPFALVSCSTPPPSPVADVVSYTQHCGGVELTPRLAMRVSRWRPPSPEDGLIVVQACIPQGGCVPVLAYEDGLPPRFELSNRNLIISVSSSRAPERYATDVAVERGLRVPVEIRQIPLSDTEAFMEFRRSLGLGPAAFEWQCEGARVWPSIEPRSADATQIGGSE